MINRKVVLVGDRFSEKNAIRIRACQNLFDLKKPAKSVGSNLSKKLITHEEASILLNIWDTASEEKFYHSIITYVKDAIVIFVFSLANENSFINFKQLYNLVKQNLDKNPILFLVGNKNDLFDERVISFERGQEAAREINAIYFEVSSETGDGIEELFGEVATESLKPGLARLVINSISCDFQESKTFCPYIAFTYDGLTKDVNPEWNETIDFLINLRGNDKLKINMFKSKDGNKLIEEISIPIHNCFNLKYEKDVIIKKSFLSRKENCHLSINLDIIDSEDIIPHSKPILYNKISCDNYEKQDNKISDNMQEKNDDKHEIQFREAKKIEFKIINRETIEKLLQIKQKVGSGATSTVYKVKEIFKGEGVLAIKILNDAFFQLMKPTGKKSKKDVWEDDDDDFDDDDKEEKEIPIKEIQKIFQEWELLSQLDHPNIIKTFGFYNGDETCPPSIILEYCKFSLDKAIDNLENTDLVKIVYQICKAMDYLHENKIIHRDLKVKYQFQTMFI